MGLSRCSLTMERSKIVQKSRIRTVNVVKKVFSKMTSDFNTFFDKVQATNIIKRQSLVAVLLPF